MSSKVLLLAEFGGVSINPYNQLSCLQQSHCIERDNDRLLFMLSVFAIRSFRANQHKMPGKAFQCWFWWKRSKAKHMEQPEPCGSNEYVEGDIFRDGGLFVSSASFYHSLCIVQALFWFLGAVSVGVKGVELLHKQLNWYCSCYTYMTVLFEKLGPGTKSKVQVQRRSLGPPTHPTTQTFRTLPRHLGV